MTESTTRELVLETRKLRKEYHSPTGMLPVLRGIDLKLHRGEFVAVMGLSGVGKSTLLNILGLLDRLSDGEILYYLDGEGIAASKLSRTQTGQLQNQFVGFVFQFFHLLPDLNVEENVMLPAMIHRSKGQYRKDETELRARADELMKKVGIYDRRLHRPRELSGGERQRVAIARALMNEPQLLLCDEPTGNLDTETSERVHKLFEELNRDLGTTILVVTHDPGFASRADRTLHMVDGSFVEDESS